MSFTDFCRVRKLVGVSVTVFQAGQVGHVARDTTPGLHPQNNLEAAIKRSQDHLLSEQKPEGYWIGELMVDSKLVSDTIAYHHWDGKVDKEWERKAVNHLLSMQLFLFHLQL